MPPKEAWQLTIELIRIDKMNTGVVFFNPRDVSTFGDGIHQPENMYTFLDKIVCPHDSIPEVGLAEDGMGDSVSVLNTKTFKVQGVMETQANMLGVCAWAPGTLPELEGVMMWVGKIPPVQFRPWQTIKFTPGKLAVELHTYLAAPTSNLEPFIPPKLEDIAHPPGTFVQLSDGSVKVYDTKGRSIMFPGISDACSRIPADVHSTVFGDEYRARNAMDVTRLIDASRVPVPTEVEEADAASRTYPF